MVLFVDPAEMYSIPLSTPRRLSTLHAVPARELGKAHALRRSLETREGRMIS